MLKLEIEVGTKFTFEKKISKEDVEKFGEISGDLNPIHFSKEYAAKTRFKTPVVHGLLTASIISAAISRNIPGAIYLAQNIKFIKPVKIGDVVCAKLTVTNIDKIKDIINLSTECTLNNGDIVIIGNALILWENNNL